MNAVPLKINSLFLECRSTLNNTMGQIVYANWKHYNIVCSSKACCNTLSFSSSHAFVQWNTSSFICPSFYLYWSIGIRRRRHLYTGRSWQGYPGGCLECRQASPAWCDQSILLCLTTNVFLSVFAASEDCIHIVDIALLMSLHTIKVQQDASRQLTSDKAEQISKHHKPLTRCWLMTSEWIKEFWISVVKTATWHESTQRKCILKYGNDGCTSTRWTPRWCLMEWLSILHTFVSRTPPFEQNSL